MPMGAAIDLSSATGRRKRSHGGNRMSRRLRIATYNVNGVNGRLPRLLEWLDETQPDIACLQELKTDDTRFPIHALGAAGYAACWHGQPSHHGVAVLAKGRKPTELRRGLPGEPEDKHTRYLEVQTHDLVVASVYLPNGNPVPSANFHYKLRWFERFVRYARRLQKSGKPVVLAGDLNVVPTDFDIYNPYGWRFDAVTQPETRGAFRRLLAQGWLDPVRQLHPRERMYTFWTTADAFRQRKGFRLDFILLGAALQPRLRGAGVDDTYRGREKPSDHAPAWVELEGDA